MRKQEWFPRQSVLYISWTHTGSLLTLYNISFKFQCSQFWWQMPFDNIIILKVLFSPICLSCREHKLTCLTLLVIMCTCHIGLGMWLKVVVFNLIHGTMFSSAFSNNVVVFNTMMIYSHYNPCLKSSNHLHFIIVYKDIFVCSRHSLYYSQITQL